MENTTLNNAAKPKAGNDVVSGIITIAAILFYIFVPRALISAGLSVSLATFACVFAHLSVISVHSFLTSTKKSAKLAVVMAIVSTVISLAVTGIVSIFLTN